ncbi:MAG: hypothetical protein M1827_005620 [Pycnora praestabilis]|nr:MAG: hypothetical protein M1827_005620 [Pycnora praestabilis]
MSALPEESVSGLEELLNPSDKVIPMELRLYYPSYSPYASSEVLLSMLLPKELRQMRLVSRTAAAWINPLLPNIFKELFIRSEFKYGKEAEIGCGLGRIGTYCEHLTIRLEHMTVSVASPMSASGPSSPVLAPIVQPKEEQRGFKFPKFSGSPGHSRHIDVPHFPPSLPEDTILPNTLPSLSPTDPANHWYTIFSKIVNLQVLTISVTGDPGWGGLTEVESALISLRMGLEQNSLSHFHTLRLHPIHAMGILHLRWAGGAAWGTANWMAGRAWSKVKTLEIWLTNPSGLLSKSKWKLFVKVLHDYFVSFRRTLEVLKFHWVGRTGVCPLLLDLVGGVRKRDFSHPAIVWSVINEMWLGNTIMDEGKVGLLMQRANGMTVVRVQDGFLAATSTLVEINGVKWHEVRRSVDYRVEEHSTTLEDEQSWNEGDIIDNAGYSSSEYSADEEDEPAGLTREDEDQFALEGDEDAREWSLTDLDLDEVSED